MHECTYYQMGLRSIPRPDMTGWNMDERGVARDVTRDVPRRAILVDKDFEGPVAAAWALPGSMLLVGRAVTCRIA